VEFRSLGFGFRFGVLGLGSGSRVQGLGFRICDLGLKVEGLDLHAAPADAAENEFPRRARI